MSVIVVGDKVVLKGNPRPIMVVESIENGKCLCSWFSKGKTERENFQMETLEKFDDRKPLMMFKA